MKIEASSLVFRHHVFFDKEESDFLRAQDFLHPMSQPETNMWMTDAELEEMKNLFPSLSDKIATAINMSEDLREQARQEFKILMDDIL